LTELASSIAIHGVAQPLVVAPKPDGYRLVASELAGLEQVDVIVRQPDEGSSGFELVGVGLLDWVHLLTGDVLDDRQQLAGR